MTLNLYHHPLLAWGTVLRPREAPNVTAHWTFNGQSTIQWRHAALAALRTGEDAAGAWQWRVADLLYHLDTGDWVYQSPPEEVPV